MDFQQYLRQVHLRRQPVDPLIQAHQTGLMEDFAAARPLYAESLAHFRELGDPWGIALPLTSLGRVAMEQGDYTTAHSLVAEGLAFRRELGHLYFIAISLTSLGEVARCQGDALQAQALYPAERNVHSSQLSAG